MIPNMIPIIEEQLREKDKEIERLNGALQTHEILLKSNVLEIERLNNIINELEKWLKEKNKFYEISTMGYSYGVIKEVIDKLQELKGSDSK